MSHQDHKIGKYCVIADDVKIGKGTVIGDFVEIRSGVTIGEDCYIDSRVTFTGNAVVGNNVSIRNACIIARGVEIGDRSFLCPQVMFNNLDFHGKTIGGAKIGSDCFIGTNATINHGISIPDRTIVGAKAFVAKSIDEPGGTWVGIPAKRLDR